MFASRFAFQSPQQSTSNARRAGTASTNASLTWFNEFNVTTSTTQYKFGTASERLAVDSQARSRIDSANTTIGNWGTTDFTIECYIWLDSRSNHSKSSDAHSHDTDYGFAFRLAQSFDANTTNTITDKLSIFARGRADLDYWTLPTNWPTGQWNFVVIQRKSGSFAAWVNGTVLPKSNASSNYNFGTGSGRIRIGSAAGSDSGLGSISGSDYVYIDEFCMSDTYRYDNPNADIPVPTAPFTVDSYTVQLMHMDGSNGGITFTNATS